MKKLVAVTAFSLSIICYSAPHCTAQSDNANKRSLAMTGIAMPLVVHPVPVHPMPATVVSKALLRKKALQAYPKTHFDKGIYFKKKGNLDAALIEFLKSTQENPHTVRAFYEQALIFRQKHFLKLAESSLEQALAVQGNYQEARILLATIRLEQGNIAGAMQELGRSLGLDLTTPEKVSAPNPVPAQEKIPGQPAAGLLEKAPAVLQTLHAALKEMPAFYSVSKPHADSDSSPPAEKPPGNVGFAMKRYPALLPKPRAVAAEKAPAPREKPSSPSEKPAPEPEQDKSTEGGAEQNIIMVQMQKSLRFFQKHKSAKAGDEEQPKSSASAEEREKPKNSASAEEKEKPKGATDTEATEKQKSGTKSRRWFLHKSSEQQDDGDSKVAQFNRAETKTGENATPISSDKSEHQSADVRRRAENAEKSPLALKFEPADPSEAPKPERKVFRVPVLPSKSSAVLAPLAQQAPEPAAPPEPPEDDWTKRLKYLAQNGTSSLKDGEAFMFAEDSGEATLFLPNGETIRRMVAGPRDAKEVVKERRPDILLPEELIYNLQLLGKLMPKPTEETSQSKSASDQSKDEAPNFDFPDLVGKSEGLWGWFKNVFKL